MRSSGILMHISSLPSKYGIGDFGKEAYNFVDFLEKSKQRNWQILPLGITSYGDSPYQSFSAFAGNPYFIDLDEFVEKGYLHDFEIDNIDLGKDLYSIDYNLLYNNKMKLLRIAYSRLEKELHEELRIFYLKHFDWLRSFSLFMAIKEINDGRSWLTWDRSLKDYKSIAVLEIEKTESEEIYFWVFTQYYFFKQWMKLKTYANNKGINIIGDLPIYVSEDSADIWGNPSIFNIDESLQPITIAGCPPDYFSKYGQLWGNPIYNWDKIEEQDYQWWIKRIKHSFDLYDTLRIDHFRGFESYWEVEYGQKTAVNGKWIKGPGIKLFEKIKEELGELDIIAEDLGFLTPEVVKLISDINYPGMKILQFAFDSHGDSDYLPHNYEKNCVVYTGTHDNDTILSFFKQMDIEDMEYATKYLKLDDIEGISWGFIRGAWSSTANLAIAPMQDFLGLDEKARMNTPSTLGDNWKWRIDKSKLTDELADKIAALTRIYRR